ncbi:MAG: hypothetical protein OYG32_13375, partial [Rhodospirillaceae bacterium]|nr:hypothetical protein [Rhodospirillaceae bacterium]
SVAGFRLAQEVVHASYPSKRLWNDANTPSPDWFQRHHRLGTGFQSCLTEKRYPKLNRKPREGEFVFWVSEPGLPRLVRALSGDNAILVELGANDNSGKRIRDSYLDPIDLDAIIAGNSMGDPF